MKHVEEFVPPMPLSKEDLEMMEVLRKKYIASTSGRQHHYESLVAAVDKMYDAICGTASGYDISVTYTDDTRRQVSEISVKVAYE